jgi:hypothetical protein
VRKVSRCVLRLLDGERVPGLCLGPVRSPNYAPDWELPCRFV